jgi:hypothetical protein
MLKDYEAVDLRVSLDGKTLVIDGDLPLKLPYADYRWRKEMDGSVSVIRLDGHEFQSTSRR